MRHPVRPYAFLLTPLVALLVSGCSLPDRLLWGSQEERLVDAAVDRWATPGATFLEGVSGRDTVASVSPIGARAWEVAVLPLSGGAPVVWSFEVTRADVYATVPGDAFVRWLGDHATELGTRTFLPADVADAVRRGDILAVGELQVRYGTVDGSGRTTEERVAYLEPGANGGKATWTIQPVSRSTTVLLQALRTVVGDMVHTDERVLNCMGSPTPRGVPRSIQLECAAKVWTQDFAPAG
ncbi:MAG TPA: hypothetical protein VJ997_06025 [Longimicrobiales bacterium]|nr:hypothetical protein [Longimicrobiales bacterium]